VTTGLIALLAALACALACGVWWRLRNGRMRDVGRGARERSLPQDITPPVTGARAISAPDGRLTSAELGRSLGQRATLVQFSSAFCAPCRATRQVLTDVASMVEGVEYIEVDAEARLDLVRRLNVLRTPTVLVTDGTGRIVKRASGQPRKPDVIAAVGLAAGAANPTYLTGNEDSDSDARPA
jgi:thiol-disulfide isomerase/thioredoxin